MKQIVTTHRNMDFDALASVTAATLIYPGAVAAIPRAVNTNVRSFLSMHKDLFNYFDRREIAIDRVERLIVTDTDTWHRLGPLARLKEKKGLDIAVWDHHYGGDIEAQWICQEPTGATITLMIRELKAEKKVITPIQATLFLTGLYEDTGCLSFSSSTAEDAYAAGWLLDHKADLSIVGKFLRPAYGEKQRDVLYKMLSKAQQATVNGYSLSISSVEISGHVENLALVVRMYKDIVNVDAAFGLFVSKDKKREDRCIAIGRSDHDDLDIGSLMKSLGGGGHPGAGSAMLRGVKSETVATMILDLMAGNRHSSVQISDLMSFPVLSVPPTMAMEEAAKILRERGCTGLPVVEDDRLVGVISRRDFKKIRKESQLQSPVKAFMSRKPITIEPGKSPIQAARTMIRHDVGRLPVVENDKIIGIITRSDAMLFFYDLLPD